MSDGLDIFFPTDEGEEHQEEKTEGNPTSTTTTNKQGEQERTNRSFKDDIFKKWFRSKNFSGFLSVKGFLEAGKLGVDIGQVKDDGATNTLVWADAIELATYLRAVSSGNGELIYPAVERQGLPPESYTYYGGTNSSSGPISRILKVHYWGHQNDGKGNVDKQGFAFKAGHFKARVNDQGAFIPHMDQPLSTDMIKVSRAEVAEMSYRIDLAINEFMISKRGEDVFKSLNGNNRS